MPLTDLETLSRLIQAGDLAQPLNGALWFSPLDDAVQSSEQLAVLQFDTAPVIDRGLPMGVFTPVPLPERSRATLVGESMRSLTARLIISSETSLRHLLERLTEEPFLFVLDGPSVTGFITTADLGTVQVRTHFYLRLAHLESLLCAHLRARYPNQTDALIVLSPSRREAQEKIVTALKRRDTFVDDLACLSLDDLVTIAGNDPVFRTAVRDAGMGWAKVKRGLANFRDDIMHPSRPFAQAWGHSAAKLLEHERRLDTLIAATASLTDSEST